MQHLRILVTGGSGFVGGRLLKRLHANGAVACNLDLRPSSQYSAITTVGDIRAYESCLALSHGVDAICHLAALYRDDVRPRELYYQVNVDGTRNIARAAAENGVRHIVFASSFSVYGLDDAGKTEDGALSPVNDYGRSKQAAEEVLREWQAAAPGRSLQIVRPSVIFGEGNRGNVWTLVNQIATGRFALIGRGTNRKSMAYVGNIVEYLVSLLEQANGQVGLYNYADKPDLSVKEIVEIAAATLGQPIRRIPMPGRAALLLGYAGDVWGVLTGRVPLLNSERIRKFLADTSLPTTRVDESGFVRPYELKQAFVKTIRAEFPGVAER